MPPQTVPASATSRSLRLSPHCRQHPRHSPAGSSAPSPRTDENLNLSKPPILGVVCNAFIAAPPQLPRLTEHNAPPVCHRYSRAGRGGQRQTPLRAQPALPATRPTVATRPTESSCAPRSLEWRALQLRTRARIPACPGPLSALRRRLAPSAAGAPASVCLQGNQASLLRIHKVLFNIPARNWGCFKSLFIKTKYAVYTVLIFRGLALNTCESTSCSAKSFCSGP